MKNHAANGFSDVHSMSSVELRTRGNGGGGRAASVTVRFAFAVLAVIGSRRRSQRRRSRRASPASIRDRQKSVSTHRNPDRRRPPDPPCGCRGCPGRRYQRISKPLLKLRRISLTGARAIPPDQLITAYQPYLGKKVSQADLAAIAAAISDLYRAAGFHLSRAIVPPQDIRDGRVRLQVIEGSITEVALKGEGAEQFGVRPLLDPVLAEHPSRLATLERQLLLINGRPGVRIADTALEEIGVATGRFRLVVYVKTWHIYTSFGVDNLGSSSVGPWQALCNGRIQFLSAARRHAGAQSVDHARRSARACVRPAVLRCPGRHRRDADRRVRSVQRGSAGRLQAPVQRQHQDRVLSRSAAASFRCNRRTRR